ncbi:MAG: hypothetical protein KDD69_04835 [Bdellovibrionales bacterium]|nr:hypothetical protein [Bdellovibrionales bacterium]
MSETAPGPATEAKVGVHFGERLRELFLPQIDAELEQEATELIRRRKLLDFMVQPGRVTAKLHDDQGRPQRLEVLFRQFSDEQWLRIFDLMAREAYFMAKLLNAKVPAKTEDIARQAGCALLPTSRDELRVAVNDKEERTLSAPSAALVMRMCERFESDSFSIITVRGRGPDEAISELQRLRSLLKQKQEFSSALTYQQVEYEPAPPLRATVGHYWSHAKDLTELTYTIRADELPASILKWLDPLPLGGLEDEVDFLLEEGYAKVARLAQGYGLGL